jgi:hypothetical protein
MAERSAVAIDLAAVSRWPWSRYREDPLELVKVLRKGLLMACSPGGPRLTLERAA